MKKKKNVFQAAVIVIIAAAAVFVAAANVLVIFSSRNKIVEAGAACERGAEFILILGCGVKEDGKPSDMLRDRLLVGVGLYFDGAAAKILLSGDSAHEGYDEVGAMKEFCISMGVPEEDIVLDNLGVSTYDSVYRAKTEFGAEKLIIVTQSYHLYRALYIAEKLRINACGVGADLNPYAGQLFRDIREIPARTKDFILTLGK